MTEAELQKLIAARCGELGLLWFHCKDSRRNTCCPGFPDLTIVGHSHGVLFREVKGYRGVTSLGQRRWGKALKAAGGNWAVWTPDDWDTGRIQRELRELSLCPNAPVLPRPSRGYI